MERSKFANAVDETEETSSGKWGMAIDLDLCTGCQACVVACAMENNIPFVGEDDASYGRQMSWVRIERFWHGEYPPYPVPAVRQRTVRARLPGVCLRS